MSELVLMAVPAIIYVLVARRRLGTSTALDRVGAALGTPRDYAIALGLAVPILALAWTAFSSVPPAVLNSPGVSIAAVTSVAAGVSVVLRALGEEIFFRGLLGGVLVRRCGFWWGNTLQALVFLAPHLFLLMADLRLWPILPVQFVSGWLIGWLRARSGSFIPGAVVHAIANLGAALLV